MIGPIARFIALDILACLDPKDKAYFRESREKRFGVSLEVLVADRDAKLPAFRESLAPLRNVLKDQPYFAGDRPLYADYALFGLLQWARCTSPLALLSTDDPIARWRARLLDAFGGFARSAPACDV
jgi:glutathione S-transferase